MLDRCTWDAAREIKEKGDLSVNEMAAVIEKHFLKLFPIGKHPDNSNAIIEILGDVIAEKNKWFEALTRCQEENTRLVTRNRLLEGAVTRDV